MKAKIFCIATLFLAFLVGLSVVGCNQSTSNSASKQRLSEIGLNDSFSSYISIAAAKLSFDDGHAEVGGLTDDNRGFLYPNNEGWTGPAITEGQFNGIPMSLVLLHPLPHATNSLTYAIPASATKLSITYGLGDVTDQNPSLSDLTFTVLLNGQEIIKQKIVQQAPGAQKLTSEEIPLTVTTPGPNTLQFSVKSSGESVQYGHFFFDGKVSY